jgi:hypothetical protein
VAKPVKAKRAEVQTNESVRFVRAAWIAYPKKMAIAMDAATLNQAAQP